MADITWHKLQDALAACKTDAEVQVILDAELAGPNRPRWINRIRGRFKVLRNEREERELFGAPAPTPKRRG